MRQRTGLVKYEPYAQVYQLSAHVTGGLVVFRTDCGPRDYGAGSRAKDKGLYFSGGVVQVLMCMYTCVHLSTSTERSL